MGIFPYFPCLKQFTMDDSCLLMLYFCVLEVIQNRSMVIVSVFDQKVSSSWEKSTPNAFIQHDYFVGTAVQNETLSASSNSAQTRSDSQRIFKKNF